MISFIAAHWWAWPIAYLAVGALLAGYVGAGEEVSTWLWCLILWPLLVLTFIGSLLRGL